MAPPDNDDVVIRPSRGDPGCILYLLGTRATPDQFIIRTRDEAVSQAFAYATRQHVRAWLNGDGEFLPLGNPSTDEWSIFQGGHPHALLIGSAAQAAAAVEWLSQDLRAPLVHWDPSAVAEPPAATGTLLIWGVDTLNQAQQARLLAWMDRHIGEVQVVSVARDPVFPLVLAGTFFNRLYYRLNTVYLPFTDALCDDAGCVEGVTMRTIENVLIRLRAEFVEMPGLRLTPDQVQRLCGVEENLCQRALDALVETRFLCIKADGAYARLAEGGPELPSAAKANLRPARRLAS